MNELILECVMGTGFCVVLLLVGAVAVGILLVISRIIGYLMRQCAEIRYGLIGYYGAKQMREHVRNQLEKLVADEASRVM